MDVNKVQKSTDEFENKDDEKNETLVFIIRCVQYVWTLTFFPFSNKYVWTPIFTSYFESQDGCLKDIFKNYRPLILGVKGINFWFSNGKNNFFFIYIFIKLKKKKKWITVKTLILSYSFWDKCILQKKRKKNDLMNTHTNLEV